MRRIGTLFIIVLAVSALVGCGVVPEPIQTESPASATCPDGLAEALQAHLLTQPLGDREPTDAIVTEFPSDMTIDSDLVVSLVGCVMTLATVYSNGEEMAQIFGIADGLDEAEVIAEFEAAGWQQLFPEQEPWVWAAEDRIESAGIYTTTSDLPAFGFESWSEFLGPDDVILLGSIGM